MNASEARDHLHMVDAIVRTTDRSIRMPPAILIGVGLCCTAVTGLLQARQIGWNIPPDRYIQPMAWLVMCLVIVVTTWQGRGAARETLLDGYTGAVFLAAFAMALTLNVTAQHRVIPAEGMGLVWAGSFAMALLIVGAMGSRALLGGGLAMLVAVGAAGLMGTWLVGTLAVAWFVGFVVPGIVLALGKSHGRATAL